MIFKNYYPHRIFFYILHKYYIRLGGSSISIIGLRATIENPCISWRYWYSSISIASSLLLGHSNAPIFSRLYITDYDFEFQPSVNEPEMRELTNLGFLEKNENIVFLGPSELVRHILLTCNFCCLSCSVAYFVICIFIFNSSLICNSISC